MGGEEDLWTVKTETMVKTATAYFWLSSPFVEATIDDRECDSEWFFEQDDKVLVNVQTDKKSSITSRVEREIHGDIMNVTMTVLQTSTGATKSTVAHAVFK